MARVVVFGTVAADEVIRTIQLPHSGEHINAELVGVRLGGGSANLACGLALAGHKVELVGPMGNDATAAMLRAELVRRGIGVGHSLTFRGHPPRALILLEPGGERTIIVLGAGSVTDALPLPDPPDPGVMDGVYVESYLSFGRVVATRYPGALVMAPLPPPGAGDWPADILVGSEHQLPTDWLLDPYAAGRIRAGARLQAVVVTRGPAGADAYTAAGVLRVPGRPARQVDTTGAGDAFAAGLLGALLEGLSLPAALERGVLAGAAAVETVGSAPG